MRRYKQMEYKHVHKGQMCGVVEQRSLEAVQSSLLLALLLRVVEGGHAGLEMGALSFHAETRISLFLDGLERMAGLTALFAHHVQFLLQASALLPELIQISLGLGA